jgi:peptidoglycan/LPS O-acetylase OafA/YrhL
MAFASWMFIARYLGQDGPTSVPSYVVSALASVALLVAVLRKEAPALLVPPLSWIVYLGRISYGLYVFHLFALAVVMQLAIPLSFQVRVLAAFVLTVSLAAVSYTFLEKPFLRMKKRFSPTSSPDDRLEPAPRGDVASRFATL